MPARLRSRFPEEVVAAELRQSLVVINSQSQSLTWGRDNEISPRMNDRAGVPGLMRWKITRPCRCDPQHPTYRAAAGGFEVGTRRASPLQHVCAEVGHGRRLLSRPCLPRHTFLHTWPVAGVVAAGGAAVAAGRWINKISANTWKRFVSIFIYGRLC